MKKFTVKDFIAYNNPCFSCGRQISFKIGFINLDVNIPPSFLRPIVTGLYTEIDLAIKYRDSLKLFIFHTTNKILTNDNSALTKYLERHKLFLYSSCDFCHTKIESHYLNFHQPQGYIEAVGLSSERLIVTDNINMYRITSSFIEEKSNIIIEKIDKTRLHSSLQMEVAILPKYKFRDKEHFLNKMKTYLLFS